MTAALSLPLTIGLGPSAGSAAVRQVQSRAAPLVAFFSRTGNTRVVAGQIRRARDADLFEIEPAAPYPEDYDAVVRQAQTERETGFRPLLRNMVADIRSYDIVFVGFPIWGMSTPAVIRSFLAGHDLSGKTLVPFVTHGGYGFGDSMSVVAAHAPKSRILDAVRHAGGPGAGNPRANNPMAGRHPARPMSRPPAGSGSPTPEAGGRPRVGPKGRHQ